MSKSLEGTQNLVYVLHWTQVVNPCGRVDEAHDSDREIYALATVYNYNYTCLEFDVSVGEQRFWDKKNGGEHLCYLMSCISIVALISLDINTDIVRGSTQFSSQKV